MPWGEDGRGLCRCLRTRPQVALIFEALTVALIFDALAFAHTIAAAFAFTLTFGVALTFATFALTFAAFASIFAVAFALALHVVGMDDQL